MPNTKPIGVFDSGIGGITVLKEMLALMPKENFVYLGDTARVPYGIRSPETVTRYAFECADFLVKQGIKALVVACNTVSAVSLSKLTQKFDIPIIGVIEPGAKAAVKASKNNRIGVIGTEATIRSEAYTKSITKHNPDALVFALACPLFVPIVEEGWYDTDIARLTAKRYLTSLKDSGIDTLVLGCTHYPLLKKTIKSVMPKVTLIDSAIQTALVVMDLLTSKALLNTSTKKGTVKFFVTDAPKKFVLTGEIFLGKKITDIRKIMLCSQP